jgi:outer membrane receptor for ferrienterochelin and colicin
MLNKNTILLSTLFITSFQPYVFANPNDSKELDLESVLNLPVKEEVNVASKKALTIKKSPGIISLITDKDIEQSGARDLKEVLELIPGIVFNLDTIGAIGIGIRGLWAFEGKALVVIDGQEMNDVMWPTVLFGNHFHVHQIKRIEILRGPGSAIYGGQAELAVINIITKTAEELNGISAKVNFGLMANNPAEYTRRNISVSAGKKFGDFNLVAHGTFGKGNLSDRIFTDFYGSSFDMSDNMNINPSYLNVGMGFKDLSARFIMDLYQRSSRDLYSKISPDNVGSHSVLHDGYFGELKYDWKISDGITVTPRVNYKQQYPWVMKDDKTKKLNENEDFSGVFYNKSVERYSANVTMNADFTENINLVAGGEYYYDLAKSHDPLSSNFGKNKNESSVSYQDISAFAQGLFKTDNFSFTLGGRFENHSAYGSFFVPRSTVTGNIGDFHAKLLFSRAFKAPGIQNINNFNPKFSKASNIKPETATAIEFEAGYDITEDMSVVANVFDMTLFDPIIYFYEDSDSYDNFEKTGTRGFEVEYKYKDNKWGNINVSYSYYRQNDNKVDIYKIPGNNEMLLGFPSHKLSLRTNFKITDNFSINPSFSFYSERFGYGSIDKDENPVVKSFSPVLIANVNLLYKDLFTKGLDLSLTGYNLLNQEYMYIQPYNGLHAPLKGASTEVSVNLGYNFPINF